MLPSPRLPPPRHGNSRQCLNSQDLEVKRLSLQRALDANALTQQEGNVRLGDIAQRKNEVADRLNLADETQGIFAGHVGDLNSKNRWPSAVRRPPSAARQLRKRCLRILEPGVP